MWYLFYGYKLGMDEDAVSNCAYGLMQDLISCLSIYEGGAEQKEKKLTYDDIMKMD